MTDLEKDKSEIFDPGSSNWSGNTKSAGCPTCHTTFIHHKNEQPIVCPSCFCNNLSPQPVLFNNGFPEMLVPFQVIHSQLPSKIENFCKGIWLAPKDLNTRNLVDRAVPTYFPMWLLDCDANGVWQNESGFDYNVKSSQESFINSTWQTHEVIENRIRWETRLGKISRHYDNIAVTAITDYPFIQERIGKYDLSQAKRLPPEVNVEGIIRTPDLPVSNAWIEAQPNVDRLASKDCEKAAGAQHSRNYSLTAEYTSRNWTLLLLPLFSTYYLDDENIRRVVLINGQTGRVGGIRLASQKIGNMWAGILAELAAILFVIGIGLLIVGNILPPLLPIAVFLILIALVVGGCAVIPLVWPWQWNRKQVPSK